MLERGEIDIFGHVNSTADRDMLYGFTKEFGYEEILLFATSSSEILFNDWEKFNKSTVGIVSDVYGDFF